MTQAVFSERLSSRLQLIGIDETDGVIEKLWLYYDLLHRWNLRINLTALPLEDFPSPTLDRLFVEPLAAATLLPAELRGHWVDLGSGGGSPAIPLKVVKPHLDLTMTESRSRKAAFLREAVRVTRLTGVEVIADRFETLESRPAATCSLVTARAVRIDGVLTNLAAHLLKPDGTLILFGEGPSAPPDGFAFTDHRALGSPLKLAILHRT